MSLIASDDSIKEITLFVEQYMASRLINWPFANKPSFHAENAIFHYEADLLLRMVQQVLVQRECVAEYPADWREALKERFAPAWFLRRWPVRKTRIDMTVLYPTIAVPNRTHVVKLRAWTPTDDDLLPSYTGRKGA